MELVESVLFKSRFLKEKIASGSRQAPEKKIQLIRNDEDDVCSCVSVSINGTEVIGILTIVLENLEDINHCDGKLAFSSKEEYIAHITNKNRNLVEVNIEYPFTTPASKSIDDVQITTLISKNLASINKDLKSKDLFNFNGLHYNIVNFTNSLNLGQEIDYSILFKFDFTVVKPGAQLEAAIRYCTKYLLLEGKLAPIVTESKSPESTVNIIPIEECERIKDLKFVDLCAVLIQAKEEERIEMPKPTVHFVPYPSYDELMISFSRISYVTSNFSAIYELYCQNESHFTKNEKGIEVSSLIQGAFKYINGNKILFTAEVNNNTN